MGLKNRFFGCCAPRTTSCLPIEMALGIQNTLDGFAGSADHSIASLEMENMELIRQNRELKMMAHKELIRQNMELNLMANMALMQENFALAQAQALLACQVHASKALFEV